MGYEGEEEGGYDFGVVSWAWWVVERCCVGECSGGVGVGVGVGMGLQDVWDELGKGNAWMAFEPQLLGADTVCGGFM